jgi:hypothetical protein
MRKNKTSETVLKLEAATVAAERNPSMQIISGGLATAKRNLNHPNLRNQALHAHSFMQAHLVKRLLALSIGLS